MTFETYKDFRSDFQSIVYYQGLIIKQKKHIGKLTSFDKNNSHEKVIINAIDALKTLRDTQKLKLSKWGFKEYAQMRDVSKKVSELQNRIRITTENVEKYEKIGLKHKINTAKGAQHTALLNFEEFKL